MSENITLTLTMTKQHLASMQKALEIVARCGMSQFGEIAEIFGISAEDKMPLWKRRTRIEEECKAILTPELRENVYYSIHAKEVPKISQRSWEVYAAVSKALDEKGHFKSALSVSGEELPTCRLNS